MFEKNIFSLEVKKVRDLERVFEFKEAIRIAAYLSPPLYLIFSFCDLIYAPDIFYELLCIRLFIVPASIICILVNKKVSCYKSAQLNILFFIFMNSVLITIMSLFLLEKGASPYYAGLNLVAIASLSLIPWNSRFIYIPILTIYSPYYVGVFLLNPSTNIGNNYVFYKRYSKHNDWQYATIKTGRCIKVSFRISTINSGKAAAS